MKAPITAAQAMQHPTVVDTINTLSQIADKLRVERDALIDRLEKAEKDAERMDWLDSQCYAYGFQDMHEGNRWTIDGPFANLRIAIDESMEASK